MKQKLKRWGTAALLMVATMATHAEDYGKYYQQLPVAVKQAEVAQIPSKTVALTDFGAVGDGRTLCTDAFKKAISTLKNQGGGRLVVPAGVWLTGPIELESNIEMRLDHEAVIYFSPDKRLYLPDEANKTKWGGSRVLPCIYASKKHDIAITGSGIIEDQEKMRNDLLRLLDCERVFLQGVTFQNAPKFHVHPCYCVNVVMDGITVRCPWNAQNGDAIDISDCHQVLIVNSMVDAGDDGLCMKSGKPRKSTPVNGVEDVLIDHCTVYHAHGGFVLGSETASGVRRVVVRNCRFSGTETGLRFKSGLSRGGKTEQLYIQDCVMSDILQEAIIFQCDYVDRPAGSNPNAVPVFTEEEKRWAPDFQDIHIKNVVCRGAQTGIKASGILGLNCVHDIDISNCTISYRKTAQQIDAKTAQLTLNQVTLEKE